MVQQVNESTCNAGDTGDVSSIRYSWKRQPTSVLLFEKIPWTEEPGELQSKGLQRVGHDWVTKHTRAHSSLRMGSLFISSPFSPCEYQMERLSKASAALQLLRKLEYSFSKKPSLKYRKSDSNAPSSFSSIPLPQ